MPLIEPDSAPSPVIDERPIFITAVSVCAELERLCGTTGNHLVLSLIGLARCEITEHDSRLPAAYEPSIVESVHEGLQQLEHILNSLLAQADHLTSTLRLHEARLLVRDGIAATA